MYLKIKVANCLSYIIYHCIYTHTKKLLSERFLSKFLSSILLLYYIKFHELFVFLIKLEQLD